MMNMGPADAGRLTYWQFSAMRHVWNERQNFDGDADNDIEPPSLEFVQARQAELERLGISGRVH